MIGGQAKEFPYLADLKGAKFPPGDYRRESFRSGRRKSVIKRVVAFQVVGKASGAAGGNGREWPKPAAGPRRGG